VRRGSAWSLGAVLAVLSAPAAQAHVTLRPNVTPSGRISQLVVRVSNERPDAATTKVSVRFPPGVDKVWFTPVAGWRATIV